MDKWLQPGRKVLYQSLPHKDIRVLIKVAMKTGSINDISDLLNRVQGEGALRRLVYIEDWPFR
jgi:hypothetical protein